jgi:1,4-alpha-glucan branching enzyme
MGCRKVLEFTAQIRRNHWNHMIKLESQPWTADNRGRSSSPSPAQSRATPRATLRETVFQLAAAAAANVLIAADFTGWNDAPLKMLRGAGGIWRIKVTLPPGRYRYRFLVDPDSPESPGKWLPFPFGTLHGEIAVNG